MTSTDTLPVEPPPVVPRPRRGRLVAVVLAVVVALAAAYAAGRATGGPRAPADTSAEAGFARDMQTHHAQAVQMSMIVRDRTDDEAVRRLAYDVALTQQQQIGQMAGWLAQWGLPATGPGQPMDWMSGDSSMSGHDMSGGASGAAMMPGMATQADLDKLAASNGRDAEVLYLQLMIAHHRGGVTMAQAVVGQSRDAVVTKLARTIITSQQAEIEAMTAMLAERGSTP